MENNTQTQELEVAESKMMDALAEAKKYYQSKIDDIADDIPNLVSLSKEVDIDVHDKESFEKAEELKRAIKACHIQLKNNFSEVNASIKKDFIGSLKTYFEKKYDILVEAEKEVKTKMDEYNDFYQKLKKDASFRKKHESERNIILDKKLEELNANQSKIRTASSLEEVIAVENELLRINTKSYEHKSNEAAFIISNLRVVCQARKNHFNTLQNENKPSEEKQKNEPSNQEKPKTSLEDILLNAGFVKSVSKTKGNGFKKDKFFISQKQLETLTEQKLINALEKLFP